ncbi:hypothetical protein QTV49_001716 [Vibrio vulnificus]|nr:hypothetical protein [Vibrio vulnificus]
MQPYLDDIYSFLEDEYDINPNNSDLAVRLLALVQDEDSRRRIIEKSSKSFESKENLDSFLNNDMSLFEEEIHSWIRRFIEREREAIEDLFVDFATIVKVSCQKPVPEIKEIKGYSLDEDESESESPEFNQNIKNWLDTGEFEFVGHSRGFKVFHTDGNNRTQILNKVDDNYSANINRLFDKKYLLQVAEIIVKNSDDGDFFTIQIPQAIAQHKTVDEQNKYLSMMKAALEKVGAPSNKIVIDGAPVKQMEEVIEDPIPNKHDEFKEKYTGTPLKDRFFEYLDRDTSRPSRNPWINFERLCSVEGARVLALMKEEKEVSWLPSHSVGEKVSAINEFIDNITKEDPEQYFGVVAVVNAEGGVGFRPDTKPFAMKYVYDLEPTGSQLNFIKSSEFTTVEIEELITEMDEESKRELTNASDGINRTYRNEQEGLKDNLESQPNIATKNHTVEAQPVRNLESSATKAPAI